MRFVLRISAFVFLFPILIASIGCGGGSMGASSTSGQAPTIALSAQPNAVTSGAATLLSWNASNANSVSISGVGTFPASGSIKLAPTVTTTYTATATGPTGKAESSTVVSVVSSEQKPTVAFSAQPSNIAAGASTILNWTTDNATSVSIAGVGTFAANGSVKVTPSSTATYTATATGPAGTAATTTTVTVTSAQNPPPTISFNAQPNSIPSGSSAVLSWTTSNATSVSIAGVGNFAANGSVKVTPTSTATYTATATGPGGTAVSTTTVAVTSNPLPTISFNAQPNTIRSGGKALLSWTTTNATSVDIAGLGNFPANGSTNVTPTTTTTYTATAQGAGGTAQASTTVTVTSNGTPLPNLQASAGWKSWGELPPDYAICPYPCRGVTWSMQQGIKSPSMSGDATQFNIGGSTPYADVLWSNPLIGQGSTQGIPDSNHTLLPTLHNFTYDAYFYPTNVGVTQVLEFDISMYFNGVGLIWGNQCNILGGHVWDIWDNVGQKWVSTGAACNPVNNAWNHVTIQVQRESDNWLLFQSITLNGVTANINQYYAPGGAPGNWWGITVNYQMDGNRNQSANTVYVDDFTFSYW